MIVATIRESLHFWLSWIERWVSAATLIDWILIGLGVAALFVAWRLFEAPVRLGSIEVSASDTDATADDFGRKEIATMRRELARWGVVPAGGVPAGSPTANIAAAVEASPVEQGPFVGALIKLIPVPAGAVGFKVTATVQDNDDDDKGAKPYTLTYHLVRTDTGESLELDRVKDASVNQAIAAAAGEMFRSIAASAEGIFPPWSQWRDSVGMMHYRKALELEDERRWEEATDRFGDAAAAAPDNMLPRLRIANCLERRAGHATGTDATRLRIRALNVYRGIALREPHIFEARYRASVLLSLLADALEKAEDVDKQVLIALRDLPDLPKLRAEDTPADRLREFAQIEAKAARRELRRSATLRRERRLRNRLEPSGRERREVLRALRISRLALNARRQWSPGQPVPWQVGELQRLLWRARVRSHFLLRGGWQAHYNAACFYAVLPEVCAPLSVAPWDREVLRKRVFHHLREALRDPQHEISCDYVRLGDPDFDAVRGLAEWDRLMIAFCQRAAVVNYVRKKKKDYAGWGLHVWGEGVDPSANRQTLAAEQNGGEHATYRVPLLELSRKVGVVMLKDNEKDLEHDDRYFFPLDHPACTFWVYEGEEDVLLERKS
jgi:hypothetical protein